MKIRADFVTNSSSSSYITMEIHSKTLVEIMKRYQDVISDECNNLDVQDDDYVSLSCDETYMEVPDSKNQVVAALINALGCEFYEDDDGNVEFDSYCEEDREPLYMELFQNKDAIEEDMTFCEATCTDAGWEGDSDSRYYKENYDDETLKEYYEIIAQENDCSPENVTDEMFNEWVSDKTSVDETRYVYDKETNKEETLHSFTLEY